jgi:glyoxylate reductase
MKPRVLILLPLEPELEASIKEQCELAHLDPRISNTDLAAALCDADGVLLSNQRYLDAVLLCAGSRLRVVAGVGVGYDRFDVETACKRGIAVCNTPDVLTECVVNLTIGLLLALSRRLFEYRDYAHSGGWARREPTPPLGFDLTGKTFGVIGYGRIGREVTRRVQPFGVRTLWTDLFQELPGGAPKSQQSSFERLLEESDIVSLHVDLNPTSHHLIGAAQLAQMKRSAWLINTSRGPVVDQPALTAALRAGTIAGAALDVLELEPPREDDPLLALPNVLVFPHIGTSTVETRYAMRELAVRNLLAVLSGERPAACVNPQVLCAR